MSPLRRRCGRRTARRRHTRSEKLISSPITSAKGGGEEKEYSARSRSLHTRSRSGWAARRRARTRPVRVTARHALATHNGTATPFTHKSALPTIARDTRLAAARGRADHARHYAQLTEECGHGGRPMAARATLPPPFPCHSQPVLSPTRFF